MHINEHDQRGDLLQALHPFYDTDWLLVQSTDLLWSLYREHYYRLEDYERD